MVPQVAVANWVWPQADAAQRFEQHVGEGGEPQPELVGAHGRRRRAIGEQVELLLLDPVLDLAAGAVDLLVEGLAVDLGGGERGHDEARVRALGQVLGLGYDPPFAAPAVERGVGEVVEPAGRLAGCAMLGLGLGERPGDRGHQAGVAGEAEEVVDAVGFAPAINSSRAKPESARSTILTRGQRARIWATMRSTSSRAPADASMFERRSLAASRCRPQNTYSGR